jgi:hypothetical protein
VSDALASGARLVGVATLVIASPALAVEPPDDTRSLPCRPTIACTADIVPPGAFELETGATFRHIDSADRQWSFPFLAKLTLARWAQLQVGSNGYTDVQGPDAARFFDNVTAGVKLHLVDQGPVAPTISFSGAASFPTPPQDGYLRAVDALFIAYVTKDFGPLHADLNLGANDWRVDHPRAQEWVALALSMSLPAPFGVMVENYYFTGALPFATRDGGVLFAISHSPKPWLVFDFGADVGYFPSTRAYSTFVGMTIVPVLLWKDGAR